ncbi:hypothetical protein [Streptomyces sp. Ru87]|uniref:hypothetical protein n=1 Tax=Streptomyces sp. Ru87 TaxID=2044307 RepID=UPI00117C3628|nr:hypothetical protein [Streptomyces sp. Ru87]
MAATVAFTVKVLSSTPARIVAVVVALTALIATLPRLFESLQPDAPAKPPAVITDVRPSPTGDATGAS